jgi:hypothetical protein
VALVGLGACASGQGLRTEVLYSSENLRASMASGFALAPTAHLKPVADSATVAAIFSNALYIESMTQLRGIDVVSPDFVLDRLGRVGDPALEQFRQLRRRLVRDERVPESLTRAVQAVVGERILLVSWVDEEQLVGLEDMPGDYVDANFSVDVRRASYSQLDGEVVGCLIDLQESRVLWKARAHYRSGRNFSGADGVDSGEQVVREKGAYDLIALLR